MATTAKPLPQARNTADALSALWSEPVPALKPLGAARVIQSWEAPRDLWSRTDAAKDGSPAAATADAQPSRPIGRRSFWLRFCA